MNKADRERLERRRRMLARDVGEDYLRDLVDVEPLADDPPDRPPARKKEGDARPAGKSPPARQGAAANVRPLSPILRRRKRRKRLFWLAVLLAVLLTAAAVTGVLGASVAMVGDAADSAYLYFNRSGAWPADTGIQSPDRVEALGGGFVEIDAEDVVIYSAYGSKIRSIQHGYARPALTVGGARFAVYNRAGNELLVESRTRNLYTRSFDNAIMLCSMSRNGTLAVVTESERYVAEVQVFDPAQESLYSWKLTESDGTPVALEFAADNRRFAVGTVAARNGALAATVYFMDTAADTAGPSYTADEGSMILKLAWLSSTRVLAVLDTGLVLLDPSTGAEVARYDYDGATLQSVSVKDKNTALLLASHGGDSIVMLDDSLTVLGQASVGSATSVSCTASAVYLLTATGVESYAFDGTQNWVKALDAHPFAVLDARQTLLFLGSRVEVLTPPESETDA